MHSAIAEHVSLSRAAKNLGVLALPWLAVLVCITVQLHFLTHPFSTLYNPDEPPLIIRVGRWLMDYDGFAIGLFGTVGSVVLLAAAAAWRGLRLGFAIVMFSAAFLIGLAANEWVLLESGFSFSPPQNWLFHRLALLLGWFAFTAIAYAMMLASRSHWRRTRIARRKLSRRRSQMVERWGTDQIAA